MFAVTPSVVGNW